MSAQGQDAPVGINEKAESLSSGSIDKVESSHVDIDPKFERRTMLWIDFRILPVLALVYSFNLIDRINLGAAYAAGMGTDLELKVGSRFSIVTCIYFIPYILLQIPGNIVLRRLGVRNWLTFLIFAWGIVQLGMGWVQNWEALLATRILLGIFEAPFFPAVLWIITSWYKRHEVQKRVASFHVIAVTMGGLSPLLAYGLSLLNGTHGIAGWRWIFIVEGAITIGLAVITYLFIPAFPDVNTFLTKEQTDLVIRRINEDRGDALPDEITFKKAVHHLKDWTLWLTVSCRYVGSYFGALLRAAPPYGPSIILTLVVAYFADKYKHRSSFIVVLCVGCLVGNSLVAWHPDNKIRYLGVFITNACNCASIPCVLSYAANNVVSQSKRAVQTALIVALGAFGGILAAVCFRSQDYPRYVPGLAATLASQGVVLALLAALTIRHMRLNKQMREGKRTEPLEGQEGFYYTL
ncbi:MFS general substrate transporter [Coprinellus micaceus]|uniref:MFS general substrate transporter n=1 Tax=Coprinellus micaceus TaxID=71717 RepID=A0A4Y7T9T5_COPMI|nr:MFS general substrate transporter [Coprinellus micaceus]